MALRASAASCFPTLRFKSAHLLCMLVELSLINAVEASEKCLGSKEASLEHEQGGRKSWGLGWGGMLRS